jgi:acetyl-CoA carboxylase carboxyl transferase subunit beta
MPEALIGFAGPRVAELVTGRRLPRDVQTAEHMQQLGLIDAVVDRADLRGRLSDVIAVATGRRDARPGAADGSGDRVAGRRGARSTTRARPMVAPETAWTAVQHSRHPERPSAADLLEAWAGNLTPVREGGRGGADDAGCLVALAQLWGVPVVVVAQARDRQRGVPASLSPAGYRKARRGCALASRLGLPLVTIVDTPGAEISPEAEEGGLSREIAFCLSELGVVASPTLAVLLGEGGSGGALALMTADRVVCAENATLEVIAPEGASAILHRSIDHAAEMAASQAGSSWELARWGIVDVVVPEDPPAHLDPGGFIDRLGAAVESELQSLLAIEPAERLAARAWRYRNIDRLQEERG